MSYSNRDESSALKHIVRAMPGSDFTPARQTSVSRRSFLLAGGVTVSLGALIAACGGSQPSGIARLGTAPELNSLIDAPVTDIALLRTATSLEHNAIFVYEAALDAALLSGEAAILAQRFLDDHRAHAEATSALTEQLGAIAFNEPNPRLQTIYIQPALTLILGDVATGVSPTRDIAADVLALAYALETMVGATYQAYVPMLTDPSLRRAAITIGEQEARHAGLIGAVVNPTRLVSSFGLTIPAQYQEDLDVPAVAYAVPSAFGTLSSTPVILGAPSESGIRTTINLETPKENSIIYEYLDKD